MDILIIGGYGTFGFNIAQGLMNEEHATLILAGRNLAKAQAATRKLQGRAAIRALRIDRTQDLAPQISTPPDIIIDASGPFQNYAGHQNPVITYALEQACHYLDLADSLDFVEHIYSYDASAKAKGITMLSGLSTYPVLTGAVVKAMEADIGPLTHLMSGIAPSPHAIMGENVIRAIASYAGKKHVGALQNNHFIHTHGLTQTRRDTICVEGETPLANLLFSNVEGPDAGILPRHFPALENIKSFAAPKPEVLHRLLIILSRLVKSNILPGVTRLASLMHSAQRYIKFGEHRGGMIIQGSNERQRLSWHMIAEGDDGPKIPALACIIMVRKWLRNEDFAAGARDGVNDISLHDYDAEFAPLNIKHTMRKDTATQNLYEEILGKDYEKQAPSLQALHAIGSGKKFDGQCDIERGKNPLGAIIAKLFSFPPNSQNIDVKVSLTREGHKEIWERNFGGHKMLSTQEAGTERWAYHVIERFGPVAVILKITVVNSRQTITPVAWSFFGVPMPRFLKPYGRTYEYEAEGRFHFHVEICAPLIGRIVKYEGWLEEASESKAE